MIRSLPILMYHSISRSPAKSAIDPETFADHCAALARAGWYTLSLEEAEACFLGEIRLPRKACLITFDDGYLDNWLTAAPVLERHKLRGIVFPVLSMLEEAAAPRGAESAADPSAIACHRGQKVYAQRFCAAEELREMARRGVLKPAPHSMRHDRVAAGPGFTGLARPGGVRGWFSMPAYGAVWGMPAFRLGHSLTTPAFQPSGEALCLARETVPQQFDAARAWLDIPANRNGLLKRYRALEASGALGRMESEEDYRARLLQEFSDCRAAFAQLFGASPISFCWPWGDYNDIALEEAQRAGFRLFYTTKLGANGPDNRLHIRRFKARAIPGARLAWETRLFSIAPLSRIAERWQNKRRAAA